MAKDRKGSLTWKSIVKELESLKEGFEMKRE